MRFFCSDFWDGRNRPYPWCDFGLDENKTIRRYLAEAVRIYDADNGGDRTIDFVFDNGRAFRLDYSWWIDQDEGLEEDVLIEEIDIADAQDCMKKYRDILFMERCHDAKMIKYVVIPD